MLKCSTLQSKITYANTAVGINFPYQTHGQYAVREIPCHLSQINTRMGNPVARHLCLNCKTKTQPCSRAQQRCRVDQSVDVCQSNAMLIENRQQWPWPPVRSEPVSSRCYRRRRAWTEGAVVLGRRGAPACSGGGQPGADGKRNNVQGWTVFETPSTLGSLPSVRSRTSGPDRAWTSVSAWSSSSCGHGSAARRRSCSSASARRPSRIPELLPKLSRYVMGERVCWPEETAPRRPASCLDLPTWRGACRLRCHRLRRRRRRGAAGTASRAARLTLSARPGRAWCRAPAAAASPRRPGFRPARGESARS